MLFGHDVFSAATLLPSDYSYDNTDEIYVMKQTAGTPYVSAYLNGVKTGANYGNQDMSFEQSATAAANALPDGTYYVLNESDLPTPPDCAGQNRETNTNGSCGACKSGYSEDATGVCVADSNTGNTTDNTTDIVGNQQTTKSNNLVPIVIGIALIGGAFVFLNKND